MHARLNRPQRLLFNSISVAVHVSSDNDKHLALSAGTHNDQLTLQRDAPARVHRLTPMTRSSLMALLALALLTLVALTAATAPTYSVLTHDFVNDRTPFEQVRGRPYKVDFNGRAVTIDDANVLLQSGSIHYPRSTPEMWPHLMNHTRAAGLNTVQGRLLTHTNTHTYTHTHTHTYTVHPVPPATHSVTRH